MSLSLNEQEVIELIADGVTPAMEKATAKKFKDWDEVVRLKYLESNDSTLRNHALSLLRDPTIYTYAFFKNKQGKPFKLYPYQDIIINDKHDRIIFAAANQVGKSVTLCCKAIHHAIMNPGHTVLMVSRTLPQSKDLLRQIKHTLRSSPLDYKEQIADIENRTELYLKNYSYTESGEKIEIEPSRIICVPATEAALGYAADLLLLDELAFYENGEYFYRQIAQPRTYTTKGQIIVFSNPNGQQGIMWDLWNDPNFHKYRFTYLDCPTNSQEEFNKISSRLTRAEIDSTLLATFTSPEGGFINLAERKAMQEERPNMIPAILTRPIGIFFDFAKTGDRTVRTTGYRVVDGEDQGVVVLEMKEYPSGTLYNEIIDDLKQLASEVGEENIEVIGWDNTGVGSGIEDFIKLLQSVGLTCTPVSFSLTNKSRIYTAFKFLIENNLRGKLGVKIPYVAECDRQLASLRFKKTRSENLQVHHENEKDRDDYPDAICGLCSILILPSSPPVTVEVIRDEPLSQKSSTNDDIDRCECGNIIDFWDEKCTNCWKTI